MLGLRETVDLEVGALVIGWLLGEFVGIFVGEFIG